MKLSGRLLSEGISLESAMNFISDGLVIVNMRMEILLLNTAAKTICGILGEVEPTHWFELSDVFYQDRGLPLRTEDLPLNRAIRGEYITNQILHIKCDLLPNGKIISCDAYPIKEGDKIIAAMAILRDISYETEHEKKLEEQRSKIATASKLAAEVGHEINNSLAIIRTSSWIMRKILPCDEIQRQLAISKLDVIDETIQRIKDILTSMKKSYL